MLSGGSLLVLVHLFLEKQKCAAVLELKCVKHFYKLKISSLQKRSLRNAVELFYLFHTGVYTYHLRCYVYQARNLMALDKDSFSGMEKSL